MSELDKEAVPSSGAGEKRGNLFDESKRIAFRWLSETSTSKNGYSISICMCF